MEGEIIIKDLTRKEAEELVEKIGNKLHSLREDIYTLWSGNGWKALGYSNWTECVENEFPESSRRVWQELSAAKTETILLNNCSVGTIPESHLRPLTSLEPEQQREVWKIATDTAPNGKITAAHVQSVVDEIRGDVIKAKQAMAVTTYSHNSLEYYTPQWVIDAAREVMGGIDLDPATCEEAQENVQAEIYYTQDDDGLSCEWFGKVWLNPPYSKTNGRSNQDIWAQRLYKEYKSGNVTEAILLVKAALGYKWFESLFDELPVCFLRERLSFILDDGNDDGQSKQGTALFYLGDDFGRFKDVFRKYGRIIPPAGVLDALLE